MDIKNCLNNNNLKIPQVQYSGAPLASTLEIAPQAAYCTMYIVVAAALLVSQTERAGMQSIGHSQSPICEMTYIVWGVKLY